MFLASSCSCYCPIHWRQVLSREWRFNWSSTDRWWSHYIWMINSVIGFWCKPFIRGFTVISGNLFPHSQHMSTSSHLIYIASDVSRATISTTIISIRKCSTYQIYMRRDIRAVNDRCRGTYQCSATSRHDTSRFAPRRYIFISEFE